MSWLRPEKPDGAIEKRLKTVRAARRAQGHELSKLQEGIVTAIAAWDPAHEPASGEILARIKTQIEHQGRWVEQEEWRISTWFESEIVQSESQGRPWFKTTVSCDGQILSCGSPSIERAYGFMRLYQKLIMDGFYSVGPPWADQPIF